MRIPLTRRLAYHLYRFNRVLNKLYKVAAKLDKIGAPKNAIDPETGKYGLTDEDITVLGDQVRLRAGLDVILSKFGKTTNPSVFSLTFYIAPLSHPRGVWDFLEDFQDDSHENQ